jgi:hypothetical protein
MNPLDNAEIASHFRAFCGEEHFQKFLDKLQTTCREKGRLLFWQQDLWDAFVLHHKDYADLTFNYLANPIVACPVHGNPFQSDRVPIHYGLIRYSEAYREARDTRFPYSRKHVLGGCCVGEEQEYEVLYCPECRQAEQAWEIERLQASARGRDWLAQNGISALTSYEEIEAILRKKVARRM